MGGGLLSTDKVLSSTPRAVITGHRPVTSALVRREQEEEEPKVILSYIRVSGHLGLHKTLFQNKQNLQFPHSQVSPQNRKEAV